MTPVPYSFAVIRYVHDRAAGESLNIGVIVYSPVVPFVGVRAEARFERLSKVFGGFDTEGCRRALKRLGDSVNRLREEWDRLPLVVDRPADAGAVLRAMWPDAGLGLSAGPVLAGVATESLSRVLDELFSRMVSSQAPGRPEVERRTDDEVWTVYQRPLRDRSISTHLIPKTFTTPDFELKCDHTFQNSRWHVVQPVTMDFVRAESLQEKATRWLGNGTALHGHPQVGKLYLLLGQPQLEAHRQAYLKAKNLLHKMPIEHELVEESEAAGFADELLSIMREHGIVEPAKAEP